MAQVKSYKIGELDVKGIWNGRASMMFTEECGKSPEQISGIADMMIMVYCITSAYYKREKQPCPITLDDVLDNCDHEDVTNIVALFLGGVQSEAVEGNGQPSPN
jgi:hypothetical protein